MNRYLYPIFLSFFVQGIILCQSDSTDYFPLSVGNSWTYQYHFYSGADESWSTDNGIAHYLILSVIKTSDSTIWSLKEVRDIIHEYYHFFPSVFDTSYSFKDSSIFQLIEYNIDNHRIVRIGGNWATPFPFSFGLPDTLSFYRYYQTSVDTVNILRIFNMVEDINATFKRNVGVLRISHSYNIGGGFSNQSNLVLRNSVITDVPINRNYTLPSTFRLSQNYPNPFNPATTISFQISKQSRIKIYIYDILGKLVSSIYDGNISAGDHSIRWNANGQSSGIYFCKVEADGLLKTIRLVLLK